MKKFQKNCKNSKFEHLNKKRIGNPTIADLKRNSKKAKLLLFSCDGDQTNGERPA